MGEIRSKIQDSKHKSFTGGKRSQRERLGPFAIIPAGHRGVVLWWGSVEKRVMGEGFNFKAPLAESVIKVDVRVQPHPSSGKKYGEMEWHLTPGFWGGPLSI